MRVKSITVHGYKRFAAENVLYIAAPLIAMVGPNEAGKTSLLEAIRHLSIEPPKEEDPDNPEMGEFATREFSGRYFPSARGDDQNPIIVSAKFSLEPDDLKALEGIEGVAKSLVFEVTKRADSKVRWRLDPRLKRNLKPREQMIAQLTRVTEGGWLPDDPIPEEDGSITEDSTSLHGRAVDLLKALGLVGNDMPGSLIDTIDRFAENLEETSADDTRKTIQRLPAALHELATLEAMSSPWDRAGGILSSRKPVFCSSMTISGA
jgi:hypothetical protein